MARVVQVPDIRKVDLPEARQAIPHVHAYLRECILDGTLLPGTKLSQVSLAAQLGISRTPLREVLRMLQEEGLVEIEPNQRTRVAGLDPQELDDIYASRILLETLALSMTIGHFGAKARGAAKRLLTAMRRAAKAGDVEVMADTGVHGSPFFAQAVDAHAVGNVIVNRHAGERVRLLENHPDAAADAYRVGVRGVNIFAIEQNFAFGTRAAQCFVHPVEGADQR